MNLLQLASEAAPATANESVPDMGGITDNIVDISKAMNDYGIITVIMAALIVGIACVVLFVFRSNKKHTDNMTKLFNDQNKQMLEMLNTQNKNTMDQNGLLLERISELNDHHHKEVKTERNLVQIFLRLNSALKDECHKVQESLDCMRVGVYACHNGSKTNTGLSFFKASCVSEWVSRKFLLTSVMGLHTELPLYLFFNAVNDVFTKGYTIIKDSEADKAAKPASSTYMEKMGVKTSVIIGIVSRDISIGSVTIEFDTIVDDEELLKKTVTIGKELSAKLAPLLDYSMLERNSELDEYSNNK